MSGAGAMGFRWVEVVEKEFDKAFVDLDMILGEIDEEQTDLIMEGRERLSRLSTAFAQLCHKSQSVFHHNSHLETQLVAMRSEVCQLRSLKTVQERQINDLVYQIHDAQLQLCHLKESSSTAAKDASSPLRNGLVDPEVIRQKLQDHKIATQSVEGGGDSSLELSRLTEELEQVKKENAVWKQQALTLRGEVIGAKLAGKYTSKELSGRVQQLQLLIREKEMKLDPDMQQKLWNQLEAEINLHRHKTIIRECRSTVSQSGSNGIQRNGSRAESVPGELPTPGELRTAVIRKKEHQKNLGISITGGREHGVPVLVSEIHPNTAAADCGNLFVGDAILFVNGRDLREVPHENAVKILSEAAALREITLEVLFIHPDPDELASREGESRAEVEKELSVSEYPIFDPNLLRFKGLTVQTNDEYNGLDTDPRFWGSGGVNGDREGSGGGGGGGLDIDPRLWLDSEEKTPFTDINSTQQRDRWHQPQWMQQQQPLQQQPPHQEEQQQPSHNGITQEASSQSNQRAEPSSADSSSSLRGAVVAVTQTIIAPKSETKTEMTTTMTASRNIALDGTTSGKNSLVEEEDDVEKETMLETENAAVTQTPSTTRIGSRLSNHSNSQMIDFFQSERARSSGEERAEDVDVSDGVSSGDESRMLKQQDRQPDRQTPQQTDQLQRHPVPVRQTPVTCHGTHSANDISDLHTHKDPFYETNAHPPMQPSMQTGDFEMERMPIHAPPTTGVLAPTSSMPQSPPINAILTGAKSNGLPLMGTPPIHPSQAIENSFSQFVYSYPVRGSDGASLNPFPYPLGGGDGGGEPGGRANEASSVSCAYPYPRNREEILRGAMMLSPSSVGIAELGGGGGGAGVGVTPYYLPPPGDVRSGEGLNQSPPPVGYKNRDTKILY